MCVTSAVSLGISGSVDVGLSVNGAHGVHVGVRGESVHGGGLRGHWTHTRAQRCAHSRHARAHAVHCSGARRHARHGGAHAGVDIGHVHGVGRHVGRGAHAGHAHVGIHGVHSQAGVHVANRGVTLLMWRWRERRGSMSLAQSGNNMNNNSCTQTLLHEVKFY